MHKFIIQLITYNSEKYLPFLFESLRKQTFNGWQLFVLDNGSNDQTIEILQKELKSLSQFSELIISEENSGFAGGHNTLFKKTDSEYVLLLNPDMYLMPDCLEKLVNFLDTHPDAAAVSPRLMKWDFEASQNPPLRGAGGVFKFGLQNLNTPLNPPQGGIGNSFTDAIDSLGLKVFRSRRVVELHAGKKWSELKTIQPFNHSTIQHFEVFGVSGALPLYRRSALEAVQDEKGTIFDPLFFMYKEDVDLAFRLREAGYKAYVKLDSVAYHDRTAAMPGRMDDIGAADNKKTQSELVKYLSYKNHLMTLYKNEYWQNLILDFPWVFWYELKKLIWLFSSDRKVLRGLKEVWRQREILKSERKKIKEKIKIDWKGIRKWWK